MKPGPRARVAVAEEEGAAVVALVAEGVVAEEAEEEGVEAVAVAGTATVAIVAEAATVGGRQARCDP
jgi:hypothetical protein